MKRIATLLGFAACGLLAAAAARAVDSVWNYTVEVTASVQVSPPQISLSWPQDTNGTPASYTIYRKAPADTSWGSAIASIPGSATSYTDAAVSAGTVYEYQIVKDFTQARGYSGYGYIEAGIQAPLVDQRGTVLLMVDNTFSSALASELSRLQDDLVGDGWTVIRHDVGRGDSVTSVKQLIVSDYHANPAQVNTVFLFGHVPVPYSGDINPDGHPDHLGAWPADVYYGDMDGTWTDTTVNQIPTGDTDPVDRARISNVPGDGKFDQNTPPGLVRLQIGRVDLANMPGDLQYQADPSFPSEQELLRQYLNKDHAYRTAVLRAQARALIGDYMGDKESIAPAASGFRSFAPIVGSSADKLVSLNVQYNDQQGVWVPTLAANDYLFALGCGAGSYSTIAGLGTGGQYNTVATTDIVSNDLRAVFVLMFGSWNPDWDSPDNIMRAVLATPTYGLAAMASGCPHWYLHPFGFGETLGYCARLTQNNTGMYQNQVNLSLNEVHLALMGDPTLRLFPIAPVSHLSGSFSNGQVTLTWTASTDSGLAGYAVYRAASPGGPYVRLTSTPVSGTSYTDTAAPGGATYRVRAVKLQTTPSGSYFDASEGVAYTDGSAPSNPPSNPSVSAPPARLVNLSILSTAGTGSQALTAGFVIGGAGTSGSMPLLVRASGPALQAFGVTGWLPDPVLTVFNAQSAPIDTNDNWGSAAAQLNAVGSQVGAFAIADTNSKDAALTTSFGEGLYSAGVTGNGTATGAALVEVYDATPSGTYTAALPRLINLSARTQVSAGPGILTLGFAITGSGTEQVLIRGVGPGLTAYGVTGVLSAPQLQLINSSGTVLATNAGWGNAPAIASASAQVGAFALGSGSNDAALLATLTAGTYTVQVSGANGSSGVALAELYEVK